MRRDSGVPVVVDSSLDRSISLKRVGLGDRSVDENWIQRLMFEHPTVLPLLELDESFTPPIPLGREIPTSAGPIDVLYITPSGNLTVVEAKLWRSSQARREVIAQIIDYATELATWGYDALDQASRTATGCGLFHHDPSQERSPLDLTQGFLIDQSNPYEVEVSYYDAIGTGYRTIRRSLLGGQSLTRIERYDDENGTWVVLVE